MSINALNIIPGKTDSCPTMGDLAIKKKMNVSWANRKRGDIVLFDFNHNGTSDHIGIVVGLNSDGTIATIEGNTGSGSNTNGGQVQKRTRRKKDINYFIRPKYDQNVTADMVIETARSQLGVKESPKNSNKVKYNVWYYGRNISAFWCCTFVCWIFAHVEGEIKPVTKPSGKYSGTIPAATIKRGDKGDKVKALQKFLNWYHPGWKLEEDGVEGGLTETAVKVFQKTEAIDADGVYGKMTQEKAEAYKAEPKPAAKTYPGTFPTIPAGKIIECTRSVNGMRKHKLLTGDYILRFKSEERRYKMCRFSQATVINKKITYSNYPKFEDKIKTIGYNLPKVRAIKTTANCSNFIDGAVGAVTGKFVRDQGAKHNKKNLTKTNYFTAHKYSKGALLAGDICGTSKHTWMIIQGAYLSIGCEGKEVKKWQSFLNWAGFACGSADGDFGAKTTTATKNFQKATGLTPDGIVGSGTLKKAKAYKK